MQSLRTLSYLADVKLKLHFTTAVQLHPSNRQTVSSDEQVAYVTVESLTVHIKNCMEQKDKKISVTTNKQANVLCRGYIWNKIISAFVDVGLK